MDSILASIKKLLGIDPSYVHFDDEVIININSIFMTLTQIGIGPEGGFSITDATAKWSDFLPDISKLEGVKTYIYLKVKLLFDPPSSSFVLESIQKQIAEFEWRLYTQAELDAVAPIEVVEGGEV